MTNSILKIYLLILLACLSACVNLDTQFPDQQGGANLPLPPVEDRTSRPNSNGSIVINNILQQANQASSEYRWEDAAVILERGLRIEPRNPLLWQRLAQVRYGQSDYQQAIQLAAKSNTFAAGDHYIKQQNSQIMANSYQALGDYEKARQVMGNRL